jgi:hypothetical protein
MLKDSEGLRRLRSPRYSRLGSPRYDSRRCFRKPILVIPTKIKCAKTSPRSEWERGIHSAFPRVI